MATKTQTTRTVRAACPEDLRKGDYITVSRDTLQVPSVYCDNHVGPQAIVRLSYMPCDSGEPLRIRGVCLPYILVKRADKQSETIDLRQQEIVRLPKKFGRASFDAYRKMHKRANSKQK